MARWGWKEESSSSIVLGSPWVSEGRLGKNEGCGRGGPLPPGLTPIGNSPGLNCSVQSLKGNTYGLGLQRGRDCRVGGERESCEVPGMEKELVQSDGLKGR